MRKKTMISRRRFLRGAGALGAMGLTIPMLPSLAHSADSLAYPKRLVVFFSGNGTIAPAWSPSSTDGRLTGLSTILSPLMPHINDLTVLEGLDIECARQKWQPARGFHGHERGLGGILTGMPLRLGPMEANSGFADGISIDQWIANKSRGETALHSLQVGIGTQASHPKGWGNRITMSYAGADRPVYYEPDGEKLFTKIFGAEAGDASAFERARKKRLSALDFLRDDLARVEKRLSAADRHRIREHAETFRGLERQLAESVSCEQTGAPGALRWTNSRDVPAIADFQIDQTVQALACDRTRVATFQFGSGLGALRLSFIGHDDSWHSLSHEGDDNRTAKQKLIDLNKYIASKFARLLTAMKAVPEGDGTLLDHSVVLWVNELGKGNSHNHHDVPIIMAGRGHGALKAGGRHLTYDRRNHNDLLITLCHAFGHTDVSTFGVKELCSGPITELLA